MSSKILVVDDEEDYRLIVSDVLRSAGYEVRCVADGAEGLQELERWAPDLVLVDWMMPRLDGEGFCQKLRALPRWKQLPVIMLTVKRTADEEMDALHFGADDFIVKPFRREDLLSRVNAILRRSKSGPPPAA